MSRELKIDDWVKTADGQIASVEWVHEGEAKISLEDIPEILVLPVGELRRISDPYKRRPPIEGLPEERPICAFCDRKLPPMVREEVEEIRPGCGGLRRRVLRRIFQRWCWSAPFCTSACAIRFARICYNNGYRLKRKKAKAS